MSDNDARIAALEAKVGPRRRGTVEEALDAAEANPQLAGFYLGLAKMRRDLDAVEEMFGPDDEDRPSLTLIQGGSDAG
jgi:hypothetical protein